LTAHRFLRNCWYVAAWDHEIAGDDLFRRVIIGEPVLLYRLASGEIVALEDRCCHRHAPLSRGRREGDCVRCGYHGLRFDPSGACVEIPGFAAVPAGTRVRKYPVVVRNRWVFVWMGDPAGADERLLPDNFSCDHPDWRYIPGYIHYAAPCELIVDNLLDFSHLSFVHEATFGGSVEIARARPLVEDIERGLRITRRVSGVPMPNYHRPLWRHDGPIDRWLEYDFVLPGTLLMSSGARPAGAAEGSAGIEFHSCQALTPETAGTTHYFFQEAHRPWQGDDKTTRALFDGLLTAFEEDRRTIEAQAENIALAPDRPMVALMMDKALVKYRRLYEHALEAEARAQA
jgi:vanillate O-demethylase monooxygenase subunit